jgi:hypothetical protein
MRYSPIIMPLVARKTANQDSVAIFRPCLIDNDGWLFEHVHLGWEWSWILPRAGSIEHKNGQRSGLTALSSGRSRPSPTEASCMMTRQDLAKRRDGCLRIG